MRYAPWAVALALSSVVAAGPADANRGHVVVFAHPRFVHPFFFHPVHPSFFHTSHPIFFRSTVFYRPSGFVPPPFAYYPPPAYYVPSPVYYYPPPPPLAAAPTPSRSTGAADCRDYQTTVTIDGKPQPLIGTVCKGPDGNWHAVQ
ncbi:MAG TPA: hypothetical protein VLV85_06680 [Stellaceae bacterium]|nr:hypothetical protein [Stellaceae bacterium]